MSYRLPYKKFPAFTSPAPAHNSKDQKHCIDYAMPEGTPIVAVADGWVVDCTDRYSKTHYERTDKCNRISILHKNGDVSVYAHLKKGSLKVGPHEKVKKGQVIALSGQTGYATYPHLHFGIYRFGKNVPFKTKKDKK